MNPQNQQPFGYPTSQNPYQMPQSANHRKQLFLMIGGAVFVFILLLWLVFGGRAQPGQAEMRALMQNTSDALWIVDEYQDDVNFSKTKNDVALIQIILRGNYQNLNELYNKTHKPKNKFSTNPKDDEKSKEVLDSAERANMLDSEIITTLKPKIAAAQKALRQTKPNFGKKESLDTLNKAQTDLQAITEILEQPR